MQDDTTARAMAEIYAEGIKPDWWKLEPQKTSAGWTAVEATIETNDPHCRGIVLLGLDAPEEELAASFHTTAGHGWIKGFAVGRTIFGAARRTGSPASWTTNRLSPPWRTSSAGSSEVWKSVNR